jgi:signal transduction histidine kinase
VLLDEISGRAAVRSEAAAIERRRLASELHAEVLPAVRAALAEVERGASPERLAQSLRGLADELEAIVRDRSDVVLETLGLIPALEALAERVEVRHAIDVMLTIDDPLPVQPVDWASGDDRSPPPVEAAAFMITRLAVDNAIRHGGARWVEMAVIESADWLRVAVRDDGRPIAVDAIDAAIRDGRRGISEMRQAALDVSGVVRVAPGDERGTTVTFEWRAPGRAAATG